MSLRLSLFGAPSITVGDTSHAIGFERRGQLLAFLALKRSWVGRAEVAALLWPDQEARLAYANLRKALFRLASLPWAERVESNANALRFDVESDVSAFEDALRERRLADIVALHRGRLLAGFDDPANDAWTSWLGFERDRLRAAWRTAAREVLAGDIEGPAAIELAARLLDDDPLDEDALGTLMNWLARTGQVARARQAYRDFTGRLQQELGLAPSAELIALHKSMAAPVVRSGAAAQAATRDQGFIGRVVEMRRAAALLAQDDCRLLTVTGPGGVGKTRLARHAMDQLAARFPDGAGFVPLDDIGSAAQVSGRLARELGIALAGGQDPLDQVIDALRERRMLLVLDNFEQLAAGARMLDRLIAGCAGVKFIVTSRIRLGLAGEWLLPLEGLPCPDVEDEESADAFDSVRLFIHAARRVSPTLDPAVETAAIVEICRQVEGLPLALELAAAWTRVLSCREIAAELSRGIELLSTSDFAHPARHASVEMVFDQSWRLLSPVEREALARLSVFHGGFSADAARAVAAAPLPVLAALADKSLLRKDERRLRLHPLVQQLASARLGDGQERDATAAAHAAFFHNLLAQSRDASEDGDGRTLKTIDAEFENCLHAWSHAVVHGDAAALTRSVTTLLNYCEHRARFGDGLEALRVALDSPLCAADAGLRGRLLGEASLLEFRQGRYAEAEDAAKRALATAPSTAGSETRFRATSVLAGCAVSTGRLAEARSLYSQALKLARADGRTHDAASALENLSLVEKRMGDYDGSLRRSLEALAEHRRNGDSASIAMCLSNLGSMYMFMQQDAAAQASLNEALELCERDGLVMTLAFVLANLTELAMKNDDRPAARRHAERALALAESSGMRPLAGWLVVQLARLSARGRSLTEAHGHLGAAADLALTLGTRSLQAAVMLALAELLEGHDQRDSAGRVLAFAAEQAVFSAPDRAELKAEWERRAHGFASGPARLSLPLDDLLHRLVAEAPAQHAPLMALLASSR